MLLVEPQVGLGLAVQQKLAAAGQLQPCQQAQDRGLPHPGGAHHHQPFAGFDAQVHLIQHPLGAELQAEVAQLGHRHLSRLRAGDASNHGVRRRVRGGRAGQNGGATASILP